MRAATRDDETGMAAPGSGALGAIRTLAAGNRTGRWSWLALRTAFQTARNKVGPRLHLFFIEPVLFFFCITF
jgi:hypothetical protein